MNINTIKILNLIFNKNVRPSVISRKYKNNKNIFEDLKDKDSRYFLSDILLNKNNQRFFNFKKNILEPWQRKEFEIINISEKIYPGLLKEIFFSPPLLFCKGNIGILKNKLCIAIVGTRNCSRYGIDAARFLSEELAKLGFVIVSGMAVGIDKAAHEAALLAKGETIGVLGTGINRIYPPDNKELFKEMEKKGCLITEFLPDMGPLKMNFPARNRIISGLSLGVIIIEAREKSGAIITAKSALNENREVFAIPGNIFSELSRGCHKLIQDGAKLVQDVEDIISEFKNYLNQYANIIKINKKQVEPSEKKYKDRIKQLIKNNDERKEVLTVFDCISFTQKSIEKIQEETRIEKNKLLQILSFLQLNEFIFEKSTNNYVLYK